MPFLIWPEHKALINIQPADSTVGCSEIILMAARNIRVFDGRIHVGVKMTELLVPNNLENIVNYFKIIFYIMFGPCQ